MVRNWDILSIYSRKVGKGHNLDDVVEGARAATGRLACLARLAEGLHDHPNAEGKPIVAADAYTRRLSHSALPTRFYDMGIPTR